MRIRVGATFVRGQLVFDGTRIVNKPGHGRFLAAASAGRRSSAPASSSAPAAGAESTPTR